ncbi:IMPACT family protein [Microbacterium koreense]|uniref:IMPACT family protein n=1 Tax=Microbacterium koreense TaxID=323761 RepID=A0ABW2ZSQ0_9MICO
MTEAYPATIATSIERELVIRKSRFIARLTPVRSVAEADEAIGRIRRTHWDAAHNCSAMITGLRGDQARSSDDGEPAGTAGVPMLEVLRRRELTDVVAVVTRYFGGVKLGAGGLIRAYSTAVSEALDSARLVHRRDLTQLRIEVDHSEAGRFDNLLRESAPQWGAIVGEAVYGRGVTLEVWTPPDAIERVRAELAAASAGSVTALTGESRIVDVPT